MIDDIRKFMVPGIIGASFFIFGFFVAADVLGLALRQIAFGLFAGAVGGITTLIAGLHQAHAAQRLPSSRF